MAPTVRCRLPISRVSRTGAPVSIASAASAISPRSIALSSPWSCVSAWRIATPSRAGGWYSRRVRSTPLAFQWSSAERMSSRSTRPTISSTVRKPSCAISSRISSATKKKKLITCSGRPVKRARSTGSCVATPTGQVLRWHFRIMMQPAAISGAVAKPNSSAPSSAPMTTSRPVRSPPSTCTAMRPRRPFSTSVCCVSASPISQGDPAWVREVSGLAPVPPS